MKIMYPTDPDLFVRCSLTKNFFSWVNELDLDPDSKFLLNGIANGFKIVPDAAIVTQAKCRNYKSALSPEAKPLLDQVFRGELILGRITLCDQKPRRVHAIGAVAKKGSEKLRPITEWSRPSRNSLNSYMQNEPFSLESIDQALRISKPGCFYAIVDLKSAYRHVPVFPRHRELQGSRWGFGNEPESYYVDNFLCFGLSCAPWIFHRISSAIARMLRRRGFQIVCYLDDFLVTGNNYDACNSALHCLLDTLQSLGFAINWEKVVSPNTRVQFLGIILDSLRERIELPAAKLLALEDMARYFSKRKKMTKVELQRNVGHMNFAARAVYGARTFTRPFIDALTTLQKPHHHFRITKLVGEELRWWSSIASLFNGLCPPNFAPPRPTVCVQTDASFAGFGAICGTSYFAGSWRDAAAPEVAKVLNWIPAPLLDIEFLGNINFLELVSACLPLLVWAPQFSGCRVVVFSDNTQTVAYINRGTTKNASALLWLKLVFYSSTAYNSHVSAAYVPGVDNTGPDALSRITLGDQHLNRCRNNFFHPKKELPRGFLCRYPNVKTGRSVLELEAHFTRTLHATNSSLAVEELSTLLQKV